MAERGDRAVQARAQPARRRRRAGEIQRRRTAARSDEHRRPQGQAWRANPLRRLGLDADRRLGHQHRDPHPGRPRVRHPALVRTGGRARPAPPVLRSEPETGLFDVEYADIMGIPFDFTGKPQTATPITPKPVTRVHAMQASAASWKSSSRASAAIARDLPEEKLDAKFHRGLAPDASRRTTSAQPRSSWRASSAKASRSHLQVLESMRPVRDQLQPRQTSALSRISAMTTALAKQHLFPQIQRLARRWIDEGYLVMQGRAGRRDPLSGARSPRAAEKSTSPCRRATRQAGSRRCSIPTIPRDRRATSISSRPSHAGRPARGHRSAISAMSCSTVAGKSNWR